MFRTAKRKYFEFIQAFELRLRLAKKKMLRYRDAKNIACMAAKDYLLVREANRYFSPLTPVLIDGEQYMRYEKELSYALMNPDVLNIAITGKYGAGKSSLIKTFVKRNKHLNYAWVSLATFASKDEIEDELSQSNSRAADGKNVPSMIDRIEETIVQQLLYSVQTKKLPKTRLKRIYQAKKHEILFFTVAVFCWCAMALRLYPSYFKWPDKFTPPRSLEILSAAPMWLAEFVFIAGIIYVLYKLVQLALSVNIDSLTVKGGKIEITNPGSVLHKNIDEIIYCFEQSDIDVVLIEDLDRFEIPDVFFRLREINFIIKNSPQIKRPIHFVYALRDDFFAVSEKTKFFDAIIPVIPVVNTDNSKAQMRDLLSKRKPWNSDDKGSGLFMNLEPKLVDAISNYIDDMRVIKNVVNEYDINVHILSGDIQLNRNKLFAIIVIRNLYPISYAALMQRDGEIYGIFKHFEQWRAKRTAELEKKLGDAKEILEAQKSMTGGSIEELRALVWLLILKHCGGYRAAAVGSQQNDCATLTEFVTDDVFKKYMVSNDRVTTFAGASGWMQQVGDWITTKTFLNYKTANGLTYAEGISLVNERVSARESAVRKLEEDHHTLRTLTFRNANSDPDFSASIAAYCVENKLGALSYLIRHGHFGEDYIDYVGYFYHGSVSLNDKKLTMAIREGQAIEANSTIDNPEAMLEVLMEEGLGSGRGLAIEIVNFLCSKPEEYRRPNIKAILSDADKHINRLADVVKGLWEKPSLQSFIADMYVHNRRCLWHLIESNEFLKSAELNQKFVIEVFDNLSSEEINRLTSEEQLTLIAAIAKLENVSLLLKKLESGVSGWKWLREYPVRFGSLGEDTPAEVIEKLLDCGCIKLNLDMLKLIIRGVGNGDGENLNVTIAGLLLSSFSHIKKSLESQITLVGTELSKQEGKLEETNDSLKFLVPLLFDVDEEELIAKFLDKTDVSFENLDDVPDYLWIRIFESNRVLPTANCVYEYFTKYLCCDEENQDEQNEDDSAQNAFNDYLSLHAPSLGELLWLVDEVHSNALKTYILNQEKIANSAMSLLLAHAHIDNADFLPNELDEERWNVLINMGILAVNLEIQNAVRDAVPNLLSKFLILNWDNAKSVIGLAKLSSDVMIELTQSGKMSTQEKIDMWSRANRDEINEDHDASELILAICTDANQSQLSFKVDSEDLLYTAVMDDKLPFELRLEGLIQLLPHINRLKACEVLSRIQEDGWNKFSDGRGKISVNMNPLNMRLMTSLNHRGFVGTVSSIDEKIVAHGTLQQ